MNGIVLIDEDMWGSYFTFVLACGLGLLISTPNPVPLSGIVQGGVFRAFSLFFSFYIIFSATFGLNMGGFSLARNEFGVSLFRATVARGLFLQLICVPFFVFKRTLFPGREPVFLLIMTFGFFLIMFFAGVSRLLESPSFLEVTIGFLVKYLVLIGYFFLPYGLLSALKNVNTVLHGGRMLPLVINFMLIVPTSFVIWGMILARRDERNV